jgi:hypothetical protein
MRFILIISFVLTALSAFASSDDLYNTTIDGHNYNAAIVIKKNGELSNLIDFEDFFQDQSSLCYNGDFDMAYLIALELENDIWIYDEYDMYSIEQKSDAIEFKVFDSFSFHDQDANESDKESFMTIFNAPKCQF